MGLSFTHILIVLIVVLIVFGAGKLPKVMGDLGKGIRNFKEGMDGHKDVEADSKLMLEKDEEKKG